MFFYKDTGTGGASSFTTLPCKTARLADGMVAANHIGADGNNQVVIVVGRQGAEGIQSNVSIDPYNENGLSRASNKGFVQRSKRCIASNGANLRVFEMFIPLAYLFDFYNSNKFPFRGLQHEISLYMDSNTNNFIMRGANTPNNNARFIFNKISMWVPRMKPSLARMAELDAKFASGALTTIRWEQYNHFISPKIDHGVTTYTWRVTAMQSRPMKINVFFQLALRNDGDKTYNKMIFDQCEIKTIEVRVNGFNFPRVQYSVEYNTNEEDYLRAYMYFLESQNKMLFDENGSIVSYEEFKSLYPIYVFDLSKIERRVFENVSASEIEIRFTRTGGGDANNDFYCFCILESIKEGAMKAVDQKLMITL